MGELHIMVLNSRLEDIYEDSVLRFVALARSIPPEAENLPVPACPLWTVHDIVAHASSVADLTQPGAAPRPEYDPQWCSERLEQRRGRPMNELLDEWEGSLPALLHLITRKRLSGCQLVTDAVTHEQDVRGALDFTGGHDTKGHSFAFSRNVKLLGSRIREAGLPALRLSTEHGSWTAGDGRPATTVSAPSFELGRAMSARRSLGQIISYDWSGSLRPYPLLVPRRVPEAYSVPEQDLLEAS